MAAKPILSISTLFQNCIPSQCGPYCNLYVYASVSMIYFEAYNDLVPIHRKFIAKTNVEFYEMNIWKQVSVNHNSKLHLRYVGSIDSSRFQFMPLRKYLCHTQPLTKTLMRYHLAAFMFALLSYLLYSNMLCFLLVDHDYWFCNWDNRYSISQEIFTRFCCALLCCGYAIVHMDSHEVFIHIHQGCFAGTGAIVRLPQCQWSKPDGYGKISQCKTTTKHSKAKPCAHFLGYTVLCIFHIKINEQHVRFHGNCLQNYWPFAILVE